MMTSIGIQADITDPEGILGVVRTFHNQLRELVHWNTSLIELNSSRGQNIQLSQTLVQDLEGKIQSLVDSASHMESMLRENRQSMEDNDKLLEDLTNRKEYLDTEIRNLEMQASCVDSEDLNNEQRMTGFAVADLYRKMDTLSFLHHRLDQVKQEKKDEWEEFKADCTSQQEKLQPYQEMKDHLDELILARYIGMQSVKGADQSERDLAQRLCDHHHNKMQYRQLQQLLMESQIRERDFEDDISALVAKKRDLWRRCLDLENCLDELSDSAKVSTTLRPSPAYSDLPQVVKGQHPVDYYSDDDQESDLDEHSPVCHGKMLHRCPKRTDLSIGQSLVNEETNMDDQDEQEARAFDTVASNLENTVDPDIEKEQDIEAEVPQTDPDEVPSDAQANVPESDLGTEANTEEPGTSNTTDVQTHHVAGGEERLKATSSLIMKIRKRIGIGPRSSSVKIKNTSQLTPTRSERGFKADDMKRRRR